MTPAKALKAIKKRCHRMKNTKIFQPNSRTLYIYTNFPQPHDAKIQVDEKYLILSKGGKEKKLLRSLTDFENFLKTLPTTINNL